MGDTKDLLDDLKQTLEVFNNLVQFGQLVAGLGSGNDPSLLEAIEAALEGLSSQIHQISSQIFSALSTIEHEIFGTQMAALLAYADQAGEALAEWQKNHQDGARQQALNTSESGLTGIVELYSNNVFPGMAM